MRAGDIKKSYAINGGGLLSYLRPMLFFKNITNTKKLKQFYETFIFFV